MVPLFRCALPAIAAFALGGATPPDLNRADPNRLTAQHGHAIRCAAAFAVVAAEQARGDAAALALPPLGIRGRQYLGQVGEQVSAQAGLSGEAVRDLAMAAAQRLGPDAAPGVASACLAELDAAVPPRPAPGPIDCFAILGTYADVLAARDSGSKLAATLRAEAQGFAPAQHDPATDRQIDQARARVREALTGGPATLDADDYTACRRSARHG